MAVTDLVVQQQDFARVTTAYDGKRGWYDHASGWLRTVFDQEAEFSDPTTSFPQFP